MLNFLQSCLLLLLLSLPLSPDHSPPATTPQAHPRLHRPSSIPTPPLPSSTPPSPPHHLQLPSLLISTGRTGGAIYFEIRRIKLSVGASTAKNGRKRPDVDVKRPDVDVKRPDVDVKRPDIDIKAEAAPEATLPSPESSPIRQRPVRTPKASAKKRLHDEVGDSGFWDDDTEEDSRPAKASKRAKVVKAVDDDDVNADEADFVVDDADSSAEA